MPRKAMSRRVWMLAALLAAACCVPTTSWCSHARLAHAPATLFSAAVKQAPPRQYDSGRRVDSFKECGFCHPAQTVRLHTSVLQTYVPCRSRRRQIVTKFFKEVVSCQLLPSIPSSVLSGSARKRYLHTHCAAWDRSAAMILGRTILQQQESDAAGESSASRRPGARRGNDNLGEH